MQEDKGTTSQADDLISFISQNDKGNFIFYTMDLKNNKFNRSQDFALKNVLTKKWAKRFQKMD